MRVKPMLLSSDKFISVLSIQIFKESLPILHCKIINIFKIKSYYYFIIYIFL